MPERTDTATQVFVDHHELPFAIVYNMLGSVTDTRTGRTGRARSDGIGDPRARLVRIAVNRSLARRTDISRRRETSVDPWLPEPLVDEAAPDDSAEEERA
ncbi:hypothetical protein ABZ865_08135 [Streptomyces sp. NPDC047085]|uniref:hypothetical protein n=1 Tax=Streptomyces sp. NPDC047085 TaxID=3155140 RepID=UPI0033E6F2D0